VPIVRAELVAVTATEAGAAFRTTNVVRHGCPTVAAGRLESAADGGAATSASASRSTATRGIHRSASAGHALLAIV
jgi:hypothetical protein